MLHKYRLCRLCKLHYSLLMTTVGDSYDKQFLPQPLQQPVNNCRNNNPNDTCNRKFDLEPKCEYEDAKI